MSKTKFASLHPGLLVRKGSAEPAPPPALSHLDEPALAKQRAETDPAQYETDRNSDAEAAEEFTPCGDDSESTETGSEEGASRDDAKNAEESSESSTSDTDEIAFDDDEENDDADDAEDEDDNIFEVELDDDIEIGLAQRHQDDDRVTMTVHVPPSELTAWQAEANRLNVPLQDWVSEALNAYLSGTGKPNQ